MAERPAPGGVGGDRRDDAVPVYVISVAAELAGMHAQTLRQYDRLGLVRPSRTSGGGRRYSDRDVSLLREVQRLSQEEGISLAGIGRIIELEHQVSALRSRIGELTQALEETRAAHASLMGASPLAPRIFTVSSTGDVYAVRPGERPRLSGSREIVRWQRRSL